jgi:hypothetical protein
LIRALSFHPKNRDGFGNDGICRIASGFAFPIDKTGVYRMTTEVGFSIGLKIASAKITSQQL